MEKKTPRGIRNCNPGNLRISKDKWQGLHPVQNDPSFFRFVSMEYGYRALMRTLRTYHKKWGCITIEDYINRWAPATENNTASYIKTVCQRLGVSADCVPNVYCKEDLCQMAAAISFVENGIEPNMAEIEKGYDLLC